MSSFAVILSSQTHHPPSQARPPRPLPAREPRPASAFTNAVNEFAGVNTGPAVTLGGLACDDAFHFFIDPVKCIP